MHITLTRGGEGARWEGDDGGWMRNEYAQLPCHSKPGTEILGTMLYFTNPKETNRISNKQIKQN